GSEPRSALCDLECHVCTATNSSVPSTMGTAPPVIAISGSPIATIMDERNEQASKDTLTNRSTMPGCPQLSALSSVVADRSPHICISASCAFNTIGLSCSRESGSRYGAEVDAQRGTV